MVGWLMRSNKIQIKMDIRRYLIDIVDAKVILKQLCIRCQYQRTEMLYYRIHSISLKTFWENTQMSVYIGKIFFDFMLLT